MPGPQLDVFWADPVEVDLRRETGDPLGLRAWANRIAQQLVPGLRNGTDRVQGFGLLCAALALASKPAYSEIGADECFERMERVWVLSQEAHRKSSSWVLAWPGSRRAGQFLRDDTVDLTVPLLSRQLQMGTWGMYRRAAGLLGLIQPATLGRVTAPREACLTPAGDLLGNEWKQVNVRSTQMLSHRILAGQSDSKDLKGLFDPDVPPYEQVAMALSRAASPNSGGPAPQPELMALRTVWEQGGNLNVGTLKNFRRFLTPGQARLVPQVAAVQRLCWQLEKPFRNYLVEGPSAPAPSSALAESSAWEQVPQNEYEIHNLRQELTKAPKTWLGVRRFADALAASRGHSLAAPGTAPKGYDRVPAPAMSLRAAEALFSQGFLGDPSPKPIVARTKLERAERAMTREDAT